jgi:hypothetical protein
MHWQNGMVGFGGELDKEQSDNIHHYVIERAHFALKSAKQDGDAKQDGE